MKLYGPATHSFIPDPHRRGLNCLPVAKPIDHRSDRLVMNGETMSVVAYVLLTVAVFAVLGYAQKLVEKL